MDHPAVLPLYQAWSAPGPDSRLGALAGVTAPGPIALRSRYRHLHDPQARPARCPPGSPSRPGSGSWTSRPRATEPCSPAISNGRLRCSLSSPGSNRRPATGWCWSTPGSAPATSPRARDEVDEAIAAYEEAVSIAGSDRYRFGELRARVPLGYLALAYSSGTTARNPSTSS